MLIVVVATIITMITIPSSKAGRKIATVVKVEVEGGSVAMGHSPQSEAGADHAGLIGLVDWIVGLKLMRI